MLTYAEVKNYLENLPSLNYRAKRVKEYLEEFSFIEKDKIEELKKELENLNILRLKNKERALIQLINFMPISPDEVRVVLAGEHITLPAEEVEKIVNVFKKYK